MRFAPAGMETFRLGEIPTQIMEGHLQPFLLRGLGHVVRGPVLLVRHLLHDGHGPRQRFAAIRMYFPLNRVFDRKNMLLTFVCDDFSLYPRGLPAHTL
jgi:hypothetical protein